MATNSSYFTLPSLGQSSSLLLPSSFNDLGSSYVEDHAAFWDGKDKYSNPLLESRDKSSSDELFVNSGSKENEWLTSAWDWMNSEQGSSILGGALTGAAEIWAADKKSEHLSSNNDDLITITQMKIDAEREAQERAIAAQMELAMLEEKRKDKHNESINAPVDMSLRSFK